VKTTGTVTRVGRRILDDDGHANLSTPTPAIAGSTRTQCVAHRNLSHLLGPVRQSSSLQINNYFSPSRLPSPNDHASPNLCSLDQAINLADRESGAKRLHSQVFEN